MSFIHRLYKFLPDTYDKLIISMDPNNSTRVLTGSSGQKYTITQKFNDWVAFVMDKKNKETYGNLTKAAAVAYGYDLNNTTEYNTAYVMGRQNYEKLKDLSSIYYDKRGVSLAMWLDVALAKMATSNNPFWWCEIGEIMGFRKRKPLENING